MEVGILVACDVFVLNAACQLPRFVAFIPGAPWVALVPRAQNEHAFWFDSGFVEQVFNASPSPALHAADKRVVWCNACSRPSSARTTRALSSATV